MDRASGYTLVEVLVVVVIVAVVALIATFSLMHALDKARQRATMADLRAIASAIEAYAQDHGAPPAASGSFDDLVRRLTPQYAGDLPTHDHWGHALRYASAGRAGYTLESFGKDGVPGDDVTLGTRFDFDLDIVLANGQFVAAPE